MSAMEENANTVKVLLGHTYFHAHARKNKTHAFNFYAVFFFKYAIDEVSLSLYTSKIIEF